MNAPNHNVDSDSDSAVSVMNAADMLQRLHAVHELPTLSTVVMQVNDMLQNINTSAQELATVIEYDHAIVPKLLKLVNSSFFGLRSRVSSISHAVMLLGYNTVRNAVLSIAVLDAMHLPYKLQGFDITKFWRHAVAVAVVSKHLSQAIGSYYSENAFIAGLIHDIGKVIIARFFPDQFTLIWRSMHADQLSFRGAEQRHSPLTHAAIGAHLARRWRLPDILTVVIAQHHQDEPESLADVNELALIVHTADALINAHEENSHLAAQWPICQAAEHILRPQIQSIDQWLPKIRPEIQTACQTLLEG